MLRYLTVFAVLVTLPVLSAQKSSASAGPAAERHAAQAFEAARKAGPLALHSFLERMPKGADLHVHLSGAVYAETFLKDAATDGVCIDPVRLTLVKNAGLSDKGVPLCPDGTLPAAAVEPPLKPGMQKLYDDLVDAMSMRSFVPVSGISGHDQFFATFDKWNALGGGHAGEWLDEVATRAAAQNEQYLEIMQTPGFNNAAAAGYALGWPAPLKQATTAESSAGDDIVGVSRGELATLRDRLLAGDLRKDIALDVAQLDGALAERKRLEHCGTPAALPACAVEIRFIYQILRAFPPQQVFAQTLLGFEVMKVDPNVVGINFVQPEDAYMAMTEYRRQMRMLDYLHTVYPSSHISLHAGEIAPGLVSPNGLRFHIREAVEIGHAERIGHGVDAMYETDPAGLLKELAAKHVMVEINLTSNDVILGVAAPNHPLPSYRAAHVPVSLNTDDEGVSRIDLTHEYLTAALEFGLNYIDLKKMVRTGLEHTFLPGASLWAEPDEFGRAVSACAGNAPGAEVPSKACADFLEQSPHAAQQWKLERKFRLFEAAEASFAKP